MAKKPSSTLLRIISYNIRKLREKCSKAAGRIISQKKCAAQIGASQQMWATWESGTKMPSFEYQEAITKLFKVEMEDLWKKKSVSLENMTVEEMVDKKTELQEQIAEIDKALADTTPMEGLSPAGTLGQQEPDTVYQIPLIGLAACNVVGWYEEKPLAFRAPAIPGANHQNLFAIVAEGTSMIPEGVREGYLLYCDPNLEPNPNDLVCVRAIDGTVTVKKFISRDDEYIHMQGWNDPQKDGRQKVMNIAYSNVYIKSVAVVIIVRRRA